MKQNGSSEGRRSEIELSTLPEVAALATELMTLFKDLGITQQQYAIRTNFDKSYISRFLNGRRVASSEFIERLLREVEKHRGVQVTQGTRTRLFELRSRALCAYDPELHKLESLRGEVDQSQRDVKRLLLHQEALEMLLEQRESESRGLQREFLQLQSDWMADRVANEAAALVSEGNKNRLEDECEGLKQQIGRLKEELRLTIAQRNRAEERCIVLEVQVEAVERHIAEELEREGVDEIGAPIEYVQAQIVELAGSSRSAVYRELSECAYSRSGRDIAQLCVWLERELPGDLSEHLMIDYCRQRSAERVANFVLDIEEIGFNERRGKRFSVSPIVRDIGRRDFDELVEFCRTLASGRRIRTVGKDYIALAEVVSSWLVKYSGRRSSQRERFLIPLVEELVQLGEGGAVSPLVEHAAGRTLYPLEYLDHISESDRWDIADIFVRTFVYKIGIKSLARAADPVFRMEDQRMTGLFLDYIRETYDVHGMARILVDSQKLGNLHEVFNARIMQEAVNWYGKSKIMAAVAKYRVIVIGGDDDVSGQKDFDTARAQVFSAIERTGRT
ncbi:helix-turn-helix domain-containing protein [Streptomyces sp. Agncl-13]|uniref:helix-turn-helix domain-containing protein n=1 Tax=Streptomyces sp. Agncl-13 TaxID=3400628 RepID=UPI003A8A1429